MISRIALWHKPREDLRLDTNEVHVWRCSLDRTSSDVQSLLRTLTADERNRAERFYFKIDRERFIVSRGSLRAVLSSYLHIDAQELRFCYNSFGKPALVNEMDGESLRFNASHSRGLALFAVTRNREIGIDIEWIRSGLVEQEIAEQFFSSGEVRILRQLPVNVQRESFFRCWTSKEAYIKAKGEGLSMPLDQFEVSLTPGKPAALLSTASDPEEAARWSLRELFPEPGFVAAIAVEGKGWQLKCLRWPK